MKVLLKSVYLYRHTVVELHPSTDKTCKMCESDWNAQSQLRKHENNTYSVRVTCCTTLHTFLASRFIEDWNCLFAGTFNLSVPVDALFFIGSQLVATSHTGKIGVWNSMTQHWQVCIQNVSSTSSSANSSHVDLYDLYIIVWRGRQAGSFFPLPITQRTYLLRVFLVNRSVVGFHPLVSSHRWRHD